MIKGIKKLLLTRGVLEWVNRDLNPYPTARGCTIIPAVLSTYTNLEYWCAQSKSATYFQGGRKNDVERFRGYLHHCTRHLYYCICWLHLVPGARKHTINEDSEYPASG